MCLCTSGSGVKKAGILAAIFWAAPIWDLKNMLLKIENHLSTSVILLQDKRYKISFTITDHVCLNVGILSISSDPDSSVSKTLNHFLLPMDFWFVFFFFLIEA